MAAQIQKSNKQTDRQTDKQTNRQIVIIVRSLKSVKFGTDPNKVTNKQTDKHTDKETNRPKDRQTNNNNC